MSSADWDNIRRYVEPIVSEINQPHAELVRVEIVLLGDGQESVSAAYSYEGVTAERNAALVRHAANLLKSYAESIEDPRSA